MCLLCPQGDSVNFRRKKAFQKQQKPMSYTYRFMSYSHRLLLSHHACFQENSIWMKGICQNKQEETTPDVWALFTHSGYSLSAYGLLALQSLVQGNTQNLKPPTEKTENSFFMGLLPILSPGEKGCSVPLSCRGPCFPPGFTVGPAACCHSLFEGTHRHYGCSPGSPQDMKEEREKFILILLHPGAKRDELGLKPPFSFRAILLKEGLFFIWPIICWFRQVLGQQESAPFIVLHKLLWCLPSVFSVRSDQIF